MNAPKGTKDMLPQESFAWQKIEAAAKKTASLYNAKQIRTPVFESSDLFLRSVGESSDIVNKEMYVFEDKAGRKMALRPEGTAGVVRSYIENNLGEVLPLKTYYIESIYRYEQPQAGRYREHFQFGSEFFGSDKPEFDVELISMAYDFLREVGFKDLTLKINSIGCGNCRKAYDEALRNFLNANIESLCDDCKRRAVTNPLRALDCKKPSCQAIYASAPKISDFLCDECSEHKKQVLLGLKNLGINYVEDDKLVRGLDYYTRTVFEFNDGGLALIGGGRYDNLCEELGGKPTPCVGFGCGIERLLSAAKERGIEFEQDFPDVFVARQCDEAKQKCFDAVLGLRRRGISAETDLLCRSLKSQFKYADKQKFKYVLTIGDAELQNDAYKLKRMSDGATFDISSDIASDVGRILCQK